MQMRVRVRVEEEGGREGGGGGEGGGGREEEEGRRRREVMLTHLCLGGAVRISHPHTAATAAAFMLDVLERSVFQADVSMSCSSNYNRHCCFACVAAIRIDVLQRSSALRCAAVRSRASARRESMHASHTRRKGEWWETQCSARPAEAWEGSVS